MKKVYSKPEIAFESFAMSTSIAFCGSENPLPKIDECAYPHYDEFGGNVLLFLSAAYGCTTIVPDGYNGTCYHVPSETGLLFGS